MKLIHHLKTSTKEIPLSHDNFSTKHVASSDGSVMHNGWGIHTAYSGEEDRYKSHRYEIWFTVEEARDFQQALTEMLSNFDKTYSGIMDE